MKHIVNLVLSQPYHEHVSLRSRTKSHNHIVEARTPEEAMNRASRQYTALGYKVHTATIVEQKIEKPEPKQSVVVEPNKEPVEEALLPKQQAVADKLKDNELAANKEKAGFKYGKTLRAAKVAAKKLKEESEIQYIEEKLTADDPASKWISDFVKSDNPKFAGKSKKERINQALGAYYAAKRGTNEEVELDEAKKPLKPSYWKAEWRLGTQSEVDKNNKKIFDKLAKTDPVKASAFHDNLMRMKKKDVKEEVDEATDPGKLRVVNKKVEAQATKDTKNSEKKSKATEKAIDVAKSKKNPVNLKPVLAGDKVNNA